MNPVNPERRKGEILAKPMADNGSVQIAPGAHVSPKQFTGSQRTERKEDYISEGVKVVALGQGSVAKERSARLAIRTLKGARLIQDGCRGLRSPWLRRAQRKTEIEWIVRTVE